MPKQQSGSPDLDDVDHRILSALHADADLTNKALATRLGLAESTCAYRIRALRDRGVITGRRILIDHAAVGYPLQAIVKVRLHAHDQAHVQELYLELSRAPGVIQAFFMAGADDFYLHVAVADAEALRDFVLHRVTRRSVVRQAETQLVFELRQGAGVLPG